MPKSGVFTQSYEFHPKNPCTLQWKGLNLFLAGVFWGSSKYITIFEGSGFLGHKIFGDFGIFSRWWKMNPF